MVCSKPSHGLKAWKLGTVLCARVGLMDENPQTIVNLQTLVLFYTQTILSLSQIVSAKLSLVDLNIILLLVLRN